MEKGYAKAYKKIVSDVNKALKSKKAPASREKCERTLLSTDITVDAKKEKLTKLLHDTITNTYAVDIKKGVSSSQLKDIRKNTDLARKIIQKLRSVNNFLEETFLKEIGVIKQPISVKAAKSRNPERFLEKHYKEFVKDHINKIEKTVYGLMSDIVAFDEKLLKQYEAKEVKEEKREKLKIKDLEKVLKSQSEMLNVLEAKIPPPKNISKKLFTKATFNKWMPYILAVLTRFEEEHHKEEEIFGKIKKIQRYRNKLGRKIKHIVGEKEKVLKLKENRVLSMEKLGRITDDYRQSFHDYVSATGL